jgi:DNA polymerase type B, organellar and viral
MTEKKLNLGSHQMPIFLFKELLISKYRGYQVYAHNLSRFDLIFLFKTIASLKSKYNITIMKKDNKIISISIINRKLKVSITIKDSFLLLPSSLKKLGSNFQIEREKGLEPVLIKDYSNTKGSDFYIMKDVSHYNKEILKIENFNEWKKLITQYCINDSIGLYQILVKFRKLIFNEFNLLIDQYPTTPSLAFAIFRATYLKKDSIPIIEGDIFKFIQESYTGGSTDMILPYGKNIYVYDVNSLYPSKMASQLFPIGNINEFYSLNEVPKDSYWFAKVLVQTKSDLYIPYLQIRLNNRTVSPNGKFEMVINSCEYYNALKDYNLEVLEGYFFEKGNIFKDYINDLYNLRLQFSKSHPMNFIAKLLMNSLYGRFGMNQNFSNNLFVSSKELEKIDHKNLISVLKMDNDLYFIECTGEKSNFTGNVAVASAITAYSRIHMENLKKFCMVNNIKIFYFDTDSIFTDKPLPDFMVGKELGQLKLEYIFKEAVFLGPKIYAGVTTDNNYICKVKGFKNKVSFNDMKSL